MRILDNIYSPDDIKKLSPKELPLLAEELRTEIISTVSKTGGHLASNLGVVELTIALHRAFNLPEDKIIWDVGHQSYVHKLLTGRRDRFSTLRQYGGLSGFTLRSESEYDPFGAGHSSTSISAAVGIACANLLNGNNNYTVAVVGDGAFTGGMIYEALNNCSKENLKLIIVLNDNDMSISFNVGALSDYFTKVRTSKRYFNLKHKIKRFFLAIPFIGGTLVKVAGKIKEAFKRLVGSESLFENLGLEYIGPLDGHNTKQLEMVLNEAKSSGKCCVVHIKTTKGKGYKFAENNPENYHSVGKFDPLFGVKPNQNASFSSRFGEKMLALAEKNSDICAITAAMCDGTGLNEFAVKYPNRFFDVGIAEEHAATFAAGLCVGGKIPVFAVYSTFLQRSYDQLIHDIALQKLHVILALDRAGLVNGDGATHHGVFDVSFLRAIPGFTIYSPETYEDLDEALENAIRLDCPCAIRYPKGPQADLPTEFINAGDGIAFSDFGENAKAVIITYGRITGNACEAAKLLDKRGISSRVIKLKKVWPINMELLEKLIGEKILYVLEEGIKSGGIGEFIKAEFDKTTIVNALDEGFVTFGGMQDLYRECGMLPEQIASQIAGLIDEKRLDKYLFEAKICESRNKASRIISEGKVSVNRKIQINPSFEIDENDEIILLEAEKYVSRAGLKLEAALDYFKIETENKRFIDIGASTGGFTDCLLQRGASLVYAVDVGENQLHSSLLKNDRVKLYEKTNARYITEKQFPDVQSAVMDVSFISQTYLYGALSNILKPGAELITLVKPQFEAGRSNIGKKGIVKLDKNLINEIFDNIKREAFKYNLEFKEYINSPIDGTDGNREFLAYFIKKA